MHVCAFLSYWGRARAAPQVYDYDAIRLSLEPVDSKMYHASFGFRLVLCVLRAQ